jgi:hypothetical protein
MAPRGAFFLLFVAEELEAVGDEAVGDEFGSTSELEGDGYQSSE